MILPVSWLGTGARNLNFVWMEELIASSPRLEEDDVPILGGNQDGKGGWLGSGCPGGTETSQTKFGLFLDA